MSRAATHSVAGWAKARPVPLVKGIAFNRAVPTRSRAIDLILQRVGTAHERLCSAKAQCQRLCPPYKLRHR